MNASGTYRQSLILLSSAAGGQQMPAPAKRTSQLSLTINHKEECWVVALCHHRKHLKENIMTNREREIYAMLLQLCHQAIYMALNGNIY